MEFEVRVREAAPDIQLVEVSGDLDIDTAPALRHHLEGVLQSGVRKVIVDFANAYYIDSTGISLLLSTWNRLAERSGKLAVVCTVPRIKKVFQIVNLVDVIPIVDTQEAARDLLGADGRKVAG